MHNTTCLLETHDPAGQVAARALLGQLRVEADHGAYVDALESAGTLYRVARRSCASEVASHAACVAAYASYFAGNLEETVVWARQSARVHPSADHLDWAPLAHALAAIGYVGCGESDAARSELCQAYDLLGTDIDFADRALAENIADAVCALL